MINPYSKNDTIEVLRFFAAFAVMFVHIPTVEKGRFGVDAFFVISGYVMMLSTQASGDRFFLKRLIRIVPTYYALTIAVYLIAIAMPALLNNTTADPVHLIKSLLFIPFDKNGIGHAPILFLGWTLNYEMYFYLLFAIALGVSHQYRGLVATVLIFCIWCLCSIPDVFIARVYGDLIVFEFVLGILLYMIISLKSYRQILSIMLVLIAAVLLSDDLLGDRFVYAGLPSVLFIGFSLMVFKGKSMPRLFVLLGGASYVLYLTHPYVIQLFDKITGWFGGSVVQQWSALVWSLLIANVLAVILYQFLEIPLRNRLRNALLK
ncbi:MAG: acyltransferase family protein [Granulosicoccus sp.]